MDPSTNPENGEAVYRYYCYQCHGYSGDAKTLAAAYLEPPPRDFTAATSAELPITVLMTTVKKGRTGTAMPAFSDVLSNREIEAVAEYVKASFMTEQPHRSRYHSVANGWTDFGRFSDALPFVGGDIRMEIPTEDLTAAQLEGRALYLSACISCHEQSSKDRDAAVWELRAVSYPRGHFSHIDGALDLVSSASPYALHDRPTIPANASPKVASGMRLYQENCAFCHAADGTGKNWIGSFMEPRPRNFRSAEFAERLLDAEHLRDVISNGLAGRSMPAWRDVITRPQIDAIIAYMQAAFPASGAAN